MLPDIRSDEHLYAVPKFDLGKGDIKNFINELKGFHEQFYDCFQRSESREHFLKYMAGQFSPLERKSIEPIALAVKDGNVRAMQRFVSDAPWDDVKIIRKYRSFVNEDLGSPDGALIFDETSFVKKGHDSIGVAKQYCGTIGKVENCQVGVFAAYASENGYAMVDKRLFIPEKWFSDDFLKRRKKCKLPTKRFFIPNHNWPSRCLPQSIKKTCCRSSMCLPIPYTGSARSSSLRWTLCRIKLISYRFQKIRDVG